MTSTAGIHHVTAISSDAQQTLDFYAGLLGMRLVKRTVNFDDPTTYHFYFGDELGRPGTILTFFPWMGANRGRQGLGQAAVVSFAIQPGSLGFWLDRLIYHNVAFDQPITRYDGERVISFKDPDGLMLELVAHPSAASHTGWSSPGISTDNAVRGIYSITLWEEGYEATSKLLTEILGFTLTREQGSIYRYTTGDGGPGTIVDVRVVPGLWKSVMGVGTIHHVAFRTANDDTHQQLRTALAKEGLNPTPPLDRQYFRSVYFREPGGVLFEIATDGPGFTADEPTRQLGQKLALPRWLEERRTEIEALLPIVRLPIDLYGPVA